MARHCTFVAALGALLLLVACESTPESTTTAPAMGAINDFCPVGAEPVSTSAETVTYDGHVIGFCCDGCVGGWHKMSEADKSAFVAEAMASKASPGALCSGCGEVKGSESCCK